ncbi:MAG: VIT1/CCC1 transporter family protein [Rhodovulum sp.]|nr:VIT1/CCC1 transporter family protein [Rhodovulum sp.]|tara:strand:+ start:1113 stop:1820 length:708 start_codon:yes stop_codon:yes gene_type:complete
MSRTRHASLFAHYLRQIVYGANDGVVTTFAIVAGFAGAQAGDVAGIGGIAVLVFGFANLFADGVAMGLGEFLSGRSAQLVYRKHRRTMTDLTHANPAEVEARLADSLMSHGLDDAHARDAARALGQSGEVTAHLLSQLDPASPDPVRGNPIHTGLATFLAFITFGFVPIVPYLVWPAGNDTATLSALFSLGALVLLGLVRSRATGEVFLRATSETVLIGSLCGAVAFGIGHLVAI